MQDEAPTDIHVPEEAARTAGGDQPPPTGPPFRTGLDEPGWPTRRWAMLMAIGTVLAGVAWWQDQTLTEHLGTQAFRDVILTILAFPLAAGGYICILAILGAFPNRRRLWGGFLAAVLLSTAVTHVLKFVVGRARPDQGLGPLYFEPFNWLGEYQSFPSGHASAAATLALLLGIYFPRFRWVFYFYGAWIGFERIIYRRHFTSDVLAGYVIGALAVQLCVRWLGRSWYLKELPPAQAGRAGS